MCACVSVCARERVPECTGREASRALSGMVGVEVPRGGGVLSLSGWRYESHLPIYSFTETGISLSFNQCAVAAEGAATDTKSPVPDLMLQYATMYTITQHVETNGRIPVRLSHFC